MKNPAFLAPICLASLSCFSAYAAQESSEALSVAPLFASNMVLPMACEFPIWGTAKPGATVTVSFAGKTVKTTTAADGEWTVHFPAQPANSHEQSLRISSAQHKIQLDHLLVGQIWLFSGQSNMDFTLAKSTGAQEAIAQAEQQKTIRICDFTGFLPNPGQKGEELVKQVTRTPYFQGTWQIPTASSVSSFSAIAWWTGTQLAAKSSIPLGLIDLSIGGSGTEAWIATPILEKKPIYQGMLTDEWVKNDKLSPWARTRAMQTTGVIHPYRPGFLFARGIAPLRQFPFAGVVWYQGETNAELNDIELNQTMLGDLILGWRASLHQPKLPFFIVQLPEIGGREAIRQFWPEYRIAQENAARATPFTTLVRTKDLGWKDSADVHQPNKKPIAERIVEQIFHVMPPQAARKSTAF